MLASETPRFYIIALMRTLCSIDWHLVTGVSGEPVCYIFKGQIVQEEDP